VLAFPEQYGQLCATKSCTPTPGNFKKLADEGTLQVNGQDVTAEQWSAAQSKVASNMFAGFMTEEAETTVYEPCQEIYLYQNGSAFNHDSEPNVEQKRDADGKLRFVTTESVAEGSELCIYYSNEDNMQFKAGAGPSDLPDDGGGRPAKKQKAAAGERAIDKKEEACAVEALMDLDPPWESRGHFGKVGCSLQEPAPQPESMLELQPMETAAVSLCDSLRVLEEKCKAMSLSPRDTVRAPTENQATKLRLRLGSWLMSGRSCSRSAEGGYLAATG
jgi:hypothetical protein